VDRCSPASKNKIVDGHAQDFSQYFQGLERRNFLPILHPREEAHRESRLSTEQWAKKCGREKGAPGNNISGYVVRDQIQNDRVRAVIVSLTNDKAVLALPGSHGMRFSTHTVS